MNASKVRSRFAAGLLLVGGAVLAAEPTTPGAPAAPDLADKGYSYFLGLGHERLHYEETSSLVPVKSRAPANSALLISGAVYAVNPDWLFSIDNASTFDPATSVETWTATGPVFNGVTLTNPLLQTDDFNLSQSTTQLFLHYRVFGHVFAIGGPSFRTQTFRRFSFINGVDNAVNTPPSTTVDESTSEVLLNAGVGAESEQVRGQKTHYGARAMLGLPVWRRLQNSAVPQVEFNSIRGYDFSLQGRYSYAVHDRLQLGLWGQWMVARRSRQTVGANYEMPANKLSGLGYGIELLWKL